MNSNHLFITTTKGVLETRFTHRDLAETATEVALWVSMCVLEQTHAQNNEPFSGVRWPAPLDQPDRNKSLSVCRFDSRATSNVVPESKQAVPRQTEPEFNLNGSSKFIMKTKTLFTSLTLAVLCAAKILASPQSSTAFTYQGRLNDGGAPANGNYDFAFVLYSGATNGVTIGNPVWLSQVPVTNGLFTVAINEYNEFGPGAFGGSARWLEISTRTNNNALGNNFIPLSPRQSIVLTPQAAFAVNALSATVATSVVDGAITSSKLAPGSVEVGSLAPGSLTWSNLTGIPAGFADGVDNDTIYGAGLGLTLGAADHQFSVDFAGTGSASTAARSDHGHFGAFWGGSTAFGIGLSVTNGAANSAGLYGQQGTGSGFPYIFGNTAGVWGESSQGSGVYGASGSATGRGVLGYAVATNGANSGVYGSTMSPSGAGVTAVGSGTNGTALQISNGALRVTGSGLNTATPAFIHVAAVGNINAQAFSTTIDNPYCNNDPNAILVVTPTPIPTVFSPIVAALYDNGTIGYATNRWVLVAIDSSNDPAYTTIHPGSRYSVLVIKP